MVESGFTWKPNRRDISHALASGVEVEGAGEAGGLVAEHDVLGDGEDGDQHEVLVHHADAGRDGVAGTGEARTSSLRRISPSSAR